MRTLKIGFIFLALLVLTFSQELEPEKNSDENDTENDVRPDIPKFPEESNPVSEETPKEPEEKDSESDETSEKPKEPEEKDSESDETSEKPKEPEVKDSESDETPKESEDKNSGSDEKPKDPKENPESDAKPENPEEEPEKEVPEATTESPENPPKGDVELYVITIGDNPFRCRTCGFRPRNIPLSPFRPNDNIPLSPFRPNDNIPPIFRTNPQNRSPLDIIFRRSRNDVPQQRFPVTDPLANFTRAQKYRQLMQDMMSLELFKFESVLNRHMNSVEDSSEKTSCQNILDGLKQFQKVLSDNQVFNFTEIMQNSNNQRPFGNNFANNFGNREPEVPTHDIPDESDVEVLHRPQRQRPRFEPLLRFSIN